MKNIYDNKEFFDEYAKMSRSQDGLKGAGEWHQLQCMLPNFSGMKVLDLGCGYGWHSFYAANLGAKVKAIDASEKMIQEAKKRNSHESISYTVCDLREFDYPENTFDCVISNLVLHYIEDLKDIYQKVYKTLKKNGIFVFNIEHPTFTAGINQTWIMEEGNAMYWPVDNYFYPGIRETEFLGQQVMKYHHTLTDILQGLLDCNFYIEKVEEAVPPLDMMDLPGMKDEMRRPMMLLVKVRKN